MQAIICNDISQFYAINGAIHEALAANVPGYHALRYTEPIVHPTNGRIAITIEPERVGQYFTAGHPVLTPELYATVTELSSDWFPVVEE